MSARRIQLEDVLHERYVTGRQAAELLGIAEKTWHNKICSGEVSFEPFGQLYVSGRKSNMIWRSYDVMIFKLQREGVIA